MAGEVTPPLLRGRSPGRPPLRHFDPASGIFAHPSAGPPANGPTLFRGRYPREPGPRQARPSTTDLPTPREQAHAATVSHARTPPRGYHLAARGLHEHTDEAVAQARPCAATHDH